MKRIIAMLLALSLLFSSGLFDIVAWAAEEAPDWGISDATEQSDSITTTTTPNELSPIWDLGDLFQEADYAVQTLHEDSGLLYERLNSTYCEITGYEGSATELVIPEELDGYIVRSIGNSAFCWNQTLEKVVLPETVERICDYAFENCSALEEINIPDGVVELGERAFAYCSRLRSFDYPSSLKRSGGSIWAGCSDLETIEIPEGVTHIYDWMFADSCIREITLPDSVVSIGEGAFSGCDELEEFQIPDSVTELGTYIFQYCDDLRNVLLPQHLESLPDGMFYYCSNLRQIQLPENLTELHEYVFEGCSRLEELVLPDSITFIGNRAFANCSSLSQINYPLSLTEVEYGIFNGCTDLETMTIPEGITELPDYLFAYSDALQTVELPSTLERIGEYTFQDCTELTTIILPESLTELGQGAFYGCKDLETIRIPSQITVLEPETFTDCSRLTDVTLPEGLITISYNAFENCSDLETIVLPDSVECIGSYAFANCQRLYQINYPMSLKEANSGIFYNCRDLESIVVPEGITELPDYMFDHCQYLRSVTLPSTLEVIGEYAFAYCLDLEEIQLPESLIRFEGNAFENCERLRSISIPAGVTALSDHLFAYCSRLSHVDLPEGLTSLGYAAFYGCSDLTSIILPESLTSIDDSCFGSCTDLSAILLPEGLTRIGYDAFINCTSLTEITIPDSVTEICYGAFWGVDGVIIRCHLNSHAAAFAIENGLAIVELSGESTSDLYELDTENSSYQINYDGLSAAGNLSMVVNYAFKAQSWASPYELVISIPASCQLLEHTLTLNGEVCTDYSYDDYDGMLYIPVEESEGTVRFSIKPLTYEKITSFAKVNFVDEVHAWRTEVIGVVYAELPILSISAQAETSEQTVDVSGITMPQNTVTLSINGEPAGTATANRLGDYNITLELPDRSDGKRYTIQAETTDADGNVIIAQTVVIYRGGTPTLTGFTMSHAGQTYQLEDVLGMKPVVTFVPGEVFCFVLKFDQVDSIDSLFVVSTRNNVRKYMKAEWDESLQAYVAEGFFDPADTSYVPGSIAIEYARKDEKISFDVGFDFTSEESINSVPDDWKDANVIVNEDTETRQDYVVEKSDGSASIHVVTVKEKIPQYITINNYHEHGFTEVHDDHGNASYVRYYEDNGVPKIDVLDWGTELMTTMTTEIALQLANSPGLSYVSTAVDLIGVLGDTFSHDRQFQQLRNDIINANMPRIAKEAALADLENARNINAVLGVLRMAGTIAVGVAAISNPVGAVALAVGWKLCDLWLAHLQERNLYGYRNSSLLNLLFGWAIDPSGYVYDEHTKQRLSGVTVTAYWVPYDDSVDNFWGAVPDDDEYGEMWDASEYSQMNPLVTDAEGRYAWDVPEGWWRVEFQRDGYESTWSEWLPVPPPQTEVNVGLIPLDEDHVHDYVAVAVVEPTCEDDGYTLYACSCGNAYEDDIVAMLGHELGEWYVVTESTCTETGLQQRDCVRCDHSEEEELPLADHEWDEGEIILEPTEESEGEICYTCLNCEETRTETIPPVDHVHDYTEVVTDATCTEGGYTTYTCRCGNSYVDDETPALGHDMEAWVESKAPGCTTEGTEVRGCARCDYVETQSIPATGHSHTAVVTAPTCTEDGYTTYICACGDTYVDDETPALGHDMEAWVESKAPGCTTEGTEVRGCARCDYVETQSIPATGHSHTAVVTEPTCTEDGYTTYICACGDTYVDDETPALGHGMEAWVESKAPGCTTEGTEVRGCIRCDYVETQSIPATGHDWCEWQVIREATEEADGEEQRNCRNCGQYETRIIPQLTHTHNYTPVVTEPTCTAAGYTTYTCTCGHSYVDLYVSATGHNYSAIVTEPTCTEGGYTTHTCTVCGDSYVDSRTGMLGHEYEDGSCIRCGAEDESYVPVNPFDDVAETDYYFLPVLWAVDNSITAGTGNGKFSPEATCTRAQVVTFLWRAMGKPEPKLTVNPFTDVTPADYFYDAVLWAVENGITSGTGAGKFSPEDNCTRGQVVTFLWRTMGKTVPESDENPFGDVKDTDYFYQPVLWAVENKITSGTGAGKFSPEDSCTRGQVVTFLYRALSEQ